MKASQNKMIGLFAQAAEQELFTEAEALVSKKGKITFHLRHGIWTESRYFDLASLTKPLATATLVALLVQNQKIKLSDTVDQFFKTKNLNGVSIAQLLNHTSGFVDWMDFTKIKKTTLEFLLNDPRAMTTQKSAIPIYSDLGYLLLGFLIEKVSGEKLDVLFEKKISRPLGIEKDIFYIRLPQSKSYSEYKNLVPSELYPNLRLGIVQDRNAEKSKGVAGHAGLFANANAVHKILNFWRDAKNGNSKILSKNLAKKFLNLTDRKSVKKRFFTLGFDTPTLPRSQSGNLFSKNTVGHLGFSGTSFWWDLERDVWVILLTNRCHKGIENPGFKKFRPRWHDAVMRSLII